MTNMESGSEGQLLKTDTLGRVRTPAARREQLLDEFERSGASGQTFAQLVGVKYQTFATWIQQRRRQRKAAARNKPAPAPTASVRWLETLVTQTNDSGGDSTPTLQVHLPGGARLQISCAGQVPLAATLLRAWEKAGAC